MDGILIRTTKNILPAALFAVLCCSGCQTLRFQHEPTMRNAEVTPPDPNRPAGAPANSYTIEFRKLDGRVATVEKPLSEATHVQEALTKAGAFKKFSRVSLELERTLPNGGRHRMGMEHSDYGKRIEPEFDYALKAGDKIVVSEISESILDDAMNGMLAPLGMDRAVKKFGSTEAKSAKYQVRD